MTHDALQDGRELYAIGAMKFLKRLALAALVLVALTWLGLTAWAYWPGTPEVPIAQLVKPEDRFVTVNGVRLRYRSYGEVGDGRPDLLLLHGFGNSLQSFRELAPRHYQPLPPRPEFAR